VSFRSLTFKLILAFLVVSLAGAGLSALLARWANGRAFNSLVYDQAQAGFVDEVTAYYEANGAWQGVARAIQQRRLAPGRPGGRLPAGNERGGVPGGSEAPPSAIAFVLLDQNRTVVVPAGGYRLGAYVPAGSRAAEIPVRIDGQTIGTVFPAGQPLPLDPGQALYVARTDQALLYAALIGIGIALVLGGLLARTLVRPLAELTAASRALARGEFGHQVPIHSNDELGELGASFNQMSAGLAQASELRRQMTADIAHELRSPLAVLTGYLEGLRDGILKPTPERFDVMYGEAQQLQRLVEDLRTLSLADAGELPLNRQAAPAASLLEQVAAAFGHRAEMAGVALGIDPQATGAGIELSVDPERMLQVLANLTGNALRYTPVGGRITLAARCEPIDGPGAPGAGPSAPSAVLLQVQDTGEGIPADVLPHIFDRFYRGDPARSATGGESGLGLAIARSIVEAHGGRVSASSAGSGQGSTFTVRLPV
jgi:signal transduction histidine kinase